MRLYVGKGKKRWRESQKKMWKKRRKLHQQDQGRRGRKIIKNAGKKKRRRRKRLKRGKERLIGEEKRKVGLWRCSEGREERVRMWRRKKKMVRIGKIETWSVEVEVFWKWKWQRKC
jgi:hypothetical protein